MSQPPSVQRLAQVIDHWCERRALAPLAKLLPAWLSNNGLTDGWEELRSALRYTRATCKQECTAEEADLLSGAIAEIDTMLTRR